MLHTKNERKQAQNHIWNISFSDFIMSGNGGTYEGCTTTMRDVEKLNFKTSSGWLNNKAFGMNNCGKVSMYYMSHSLRVGY